MSPAALPPLLQAPLEALQRALVDGGGEEIEAAGAAWEQALRDWIEHARPDRATLEAVLAVQQDLIASCRRKQADLQQILAELAAARRARSAYEEGRS